MQDVELHAQKRGWARDVTWKPDGGPDEKSSRRWNVRDGGREFCVIKNRL